MEVRNCPRCGKIFRYVSVNLCPACVEQDEAELELIRNYLREHNYRATIDEIHEATGVKVSKILEFVRQGRIETVGVKFELEYPCEMCGALIKEGRLCMKCAKRLSEKFTPKPAEKPPEPQRKTEKKMYIAEIVKDEK